MVFISFKITVYLCGFVFRAIRVFIILADDRLPQLYCLGCLCYSTLCRQFVEKRGHFWEINTCQFSPLILIPLISFVILKYTLGILFYNHQLKHKVKLSWCHCHCFESYVEEENCAFSILICQVKCTLEPSSTTVFV